MVNSICISDNRVRNKQDIVTQNPPLFRTKYLISGYIFQQLKKMSVCSAVEVSPTKTSSIKYPNDMYIYINTQFHHCIFTLIK